MMVKVLNESTHLGLISAVFYNNHDYIRKTYFQIKQYEFVRLQSNFSKILAFFYVQRYEIKVLPGTVGEKFMEFFEDVISMCRRSLFQKENSLFPHESQSKRRFRLMHKSYH